MYKLFVVFLIGLLFASCEEKDTAVEKAISISNPLSHTKVKKMVGAYTGRHDSTMYLHYWYAELSGDTMPEGIIIIERISDPAPLVGVYFSKKDTLIFIPAAAQSGVVPQTKVLYLLGGTTDQLGVWYTRKEKDGTYTNRMAGYAINENSCKELFDLPLYVIPKTGPILNAKIGEVVQVKNKPTELRLYEADVDAEHIEGNMSNSPLLKKKSTGVYTAYVYNELAQKFLPVSESK